MMPAPRISVIMPVYNGAGFVGKAIGSVLAQDFEDWELIVVNDESTDGTAEVLADFTDERICVIHQRNGGEACARNRGLDTATGEYVAFLDADDLYLPNALGDMAAYLDAHSHFDALFSDGYFCDENDRILGRLSDVRPGPFTGDILEPLVLDPAAITVPICTLTRHSTIRDTGVRFDPSLVIGPDWDFWIHLARYAQFGYLDRLTCMYRIHKTNITKTSGSQRRNADLVRGRLKVMNSDWFAELSISTRKTFFYNFLINLLGNQPEEQHAIMNVTPFEALPSAIKADLFRQVASNHLRRYEDTAFALECLGQSLSLQPGSAKGRVLLQLGRHSPALTTAALAIWQVAHHARVRIRSIGKRKPKPVPTALRAVAK